MVDRAFDVHVGAEKQVATSARDSGQRRGRRVRTGDGVDKRAALVSSSERARVPASSPRFTRSDHVSELLNGRCGHGRRSRNGVDIDRLLLLRRARRGQGAPHRDEPTQHERRRTERRPTGSTRLFDA